MSLSQKLLAVIIVPLLIQVAIFGWYAYLLRETEKLNKAEADSTEVIGHINWLSTQLAFKSVAALQYASTGDKEFLDMVAECRKQVRQEVLEVKSLCAADKNGQKNLETMTNVAQSRFAIAFLLPKTKLAAKRAWNAPLSKSAGRIF
jgi:CHASE3 domain sensor protein